MQKWPLSWEEKYDLRETHGFKCDICGLREDGVRAHAIDHDHITDNIRGVLCSKCNLGLGAFRDSQRLLSRAREYREETRD